MKTNQRDSISAYTIIERFYPSPLGLLRMTFDENALLGLSFDEPFPDALPTDNLISSGHSMEEHFSEKCSSSPKSPLHEMVQSQADPSIFRETKRWLDLYFSGQQPDFIPSFRVTGGQAHPIVIRRQAQRYICRVFSLLLLSCLQFSPWLHQLWMP